MKKFMRTRGAAPPAAAHRDAHRDAHSDARADGAAAHAQRASPPRYCDGAEEVCALWEDAEFPPGAAALGGRLCARDVLWLRPHELCARPRFLGDEEVEAGHDAPPPESAEQRARRWGARAGPLALPALACAGAALAATPRLLARAVPPHSFRRGYGGAFRFHFWVFGEWREVMVDDRLPVRRRPRAPLLLGSQCALLPEDFTLPLLEKAYAKLHGGYGAAGRAAGAEGAEGAALRELSGGVVQSFAPPRQPRALLLHVLAAALPRSTLLVATVAPERDKSARRLRNGLVAGQAYLVTGLAGEGEPQVRLRAAAGAAAGGEWTGRRPPSPAAAQEPGHFWVPLAEFARSFTALLLVHVPPDDWVREPALRARRPWRAVLARRRWRVGYNAGGPPGAATAHANPQFQLSVAARCLAVVALAQRAPPPARAPRAGFALYALPPGAAPRRADPARLRPLDVSHAARAPEVVALCTLPPGRYLLVPHARAHRSAAFLLRVLTDEHADVWEVNDDNVIVRDIAAEAGADPSALPPELQATIVKVLRRLKSDEVEAESLRAALRGAGAGLGGASLRVCRALVALRDPGAEGRAAARELPALLALLAAARAAARGARRARCAYELRALLCACGVSASNKVLECVVLRHARGRRLSADAFVLALAGLLLAHERFRSLDAKTKCNPLSLEEMILMTVYS